MSCGSCGNSWLHTEPDGFYPAAFGGKRRGEVNTVEVYVLLHEEQDEPSFVEGVFSDLKAAKKGTWGLDGHWELAEGNEPRDWIMATDGVHEDYRIVTRVVLR